MKLAVKLPLACAAMLACTAAGALFGMHRLHQAADQESRVMQERYEAEISADAVAL